jgi:hypothetical protein
MTNLERQATLLNGLAFLLCLPEHPYNFYRKQRREALTSAT